MIKQIVSVAVAALLASTAVAQAPAASGQPTSFTLTRIEPPAEPDAIAIYPDIAPGSEHAKVIERWVRMANGQRVVRNVTRPTITPVLPPRGRANGAGVLVLPGGGHNFVWIDNEGWDVARWFAAHGIAAFILKYRTNETPDDEARFRRSADMIFVHDSEVGRPFALADAQQALRMIRSNAAHWGVDPARLGMIGFSAGSITTLDTVLANDPSARPSFFGYIYGPMVSVTVPAEAPPMFAALALDDPAFGRQGFGIVSAWQKANRPVELHAYEKGSHGFGAGRPGTTTMLFMDQFRLWMDTHGMLKPSPAKP